MQHDILGHLSGPPTTSRLYKHILRCWPLADLTQPKGWWCTSTCVWLNINKGSSGCKTLGCTHWRKSQKESSPDMRCLFLWVTCCQKVSLSKQKMTCTREPWKKDFKMPPKLASKLATKDLQFKFKVAGFTVFFTHPLWASNPLGGRDTRSRWKGACVRHHTTHSQRKPFNNLRPPNPAPTKL